VRLTAHAVEQYIARFRPALTTVQAHQELRSLLKDARYSGPAVSGGDYYRCLNGLTVVVKHDRGPLCVTVVPPAGERPEFPPVPSDLEGTSQEDQRVDALRAIHVSAISGGPWRPAGFRTVEALRLSFRGVVTLLRVVSGGQTGADLGGLLAAEELGVPTGGWAPKGWRTDVGPAPWLGSRFGLQECETPGYPARTQRNVLLAQATLIFGDPTSPGCRLTASYARQAGRPCVIVFWPFATSFWSEHARVVVLLSGVQTLNVAGNRERSRPGIRDACWQFVRELLRSVAAVEQAR
jgi:hypothetical protein